MVPVFKNVGQRSMLENYNPVSLLFMARKSLKNL